MPERRSGWPEEIELQEDLSPSDWILPRLLPNVLSGGEGTPVASIVPSGYPAYVRVLHPANTGGDDSGVPWRDVAAFTGRMYHPLMQWEQIRPPKSNPFGPERFGDPWQGDLEEDLCRSLYSALARGTTTPEKCWFGIWEGHGTLHPTSASAYTVFVPEGGSRDEADGELERIMADRRAVVRIVQQTPRFDHPGRSYLLAQGPCESAHELGRFGLHITPSLAWPEDRAWCVASEVDFDSTLVGASEECAAALLADDRIETLLVQPDDRLDSGGDTLNPPLA